MADQRIEKMADLMVNYSVAVRPDEKVFIRAHTLAEPLVREVNRKVLQAGGHPFTMMEIPGAEGDLVKYGSDAQIEHIPEPVNVLIGTYDCMIRIIADDNTRALSSADSAKMTQWAKSRGPIMKTYMERAAKGELRWMVTAFPTNAYAQDADMSLEEYENFVYGACMPDLNDPVGYWKRISAKQELLVKWLEGKKKVHLIGKDTDLRLSIEGRKFINCDCHVNVPDGEIFTGPVEDSMEGHVTFSYPTIYNTREVDGVHLEFKKGKVVKASAEKNEDFLLKTLDTDEGSRFVGEFAIGTNEGIQKFTRQILFDEKIGGSFHMALGKGYPESGSKAESAIHWDMICDLRDGQILVDDVLFYENGKFVVEE
ncbi:MAG: aminopeptidase [Chloroflexi bacterium]|nr:MAG: aminopeptidase [Chloroflexota bacterium]